MSAADAGRKRIESVEAEYVKVGDAVVDPNGRQYNVVSLGVSTIKIVTLNLQPKGQCGHRPFPFNRDEEVRVVRY